jgi:hypothetical protein
MTEMMRANGYRTVYLESGWSGTQCSPEVDVCVGSVWPDETLYDITYRSLIRDLPGFETGISFAKGAKHAMSAMESTLATHLGDDTSDFIYVHLLAPHPPLFLDSSCDLNPNPNLAGFAIGEPGMGQEERDLRRHAYAAQVQCVNSALSTAIERIAETGDIGLILGDHGPDLGGQLFTNADEWSDADRAERYGIFFAAFHPGCDYGPVATLVNTGRRLLSCLSGTDVPEVPNRFFDLDKHQTRPTVLELESAGSFE